VKENNELKIKQIHSIDQANEFQASIEKELNQTKKQNNDQQSAINQMKLELEQK
jgi:archaellum component FlaC